MNLSAMSASARRHWPLTGLGSVLAAALLWGAFAPLGGGSHELLFEVPRGARTALLKAPSEIRLTRGVLDVLVLRNRDTAPLVFGPLDVAPGREVRLPFEEEGEYIFACPVVAGALVKVRVVAAPGPGWPRLRWRLDNLEQRVRYLPVKAPQA